MGDHAAPSDDECCVGGAVLIQVITCQTALRYCERWNAKRPTWRSAQAGRRSSRFRFWRRALGRTSSNGGSCCTGCRAQLRLTRAIASHFERSTRPLTTHWRDEGRGTLACACASVVRELNDWSFGHGSIVFRTAGKRVAETTNRAADGHAKALPSGLSGAARTWVRTATAREHRDATPVRTS